MDQAQRAVMAQGKRKARLMRSAAVTVFLVSASLSVPVLMQAEAQGYSLSQVSIEGNQRVDAATILQLAGIKQGAAISGAQLNDAYQGLQNSGLFEEIAIQPQGARLLIRVKEYPMINVVSFEGNKRIKDDALGQVVQSKSRRAYSPAMAEADAASIAEGYRAQGRMAATVTPKIIRRSDNRVDLVFEITEGKAVEIERLGFVGNRAFSDRRLRQVLETKQAGLLRTFIRSDTLQPERLELDKQLLRDFYLSRGFVDFQVLNAAAEVSRERDGVFVTFTVQEGQSFNFGQITAVSEIEGLDAAEYEAALRVRTGGVYSPAVVENNIARLENLALQKGLTFVTIEPRVTRNERTRTLDIQFTLVRGQKVFVERIDIEGNTTTLDQVVRRQFRTVEGDPFNPREIRQSAERIRALGYFADARVEAEPGTSPDQVVVNVDVEEAPTGSLSFGASYGVSSGVGFNIGLTETNFLGRGQTVGVNVSTGTDNTSSSITFIEPAFLGRDLKFKFNAYYNETDNQNASYDTRMIGIVPAIEFPVSENGRLELRYFAKQSKLSNMTLAEDNNGDGDILDTDLEVNPDVDGSSPILFRDAAREGLFSSGVGATYSYDTRVTGLNPKGGVLLRFGLDYAGLGGDIESVALSALALAETKVWNEEVTLRAVFEGGALNMLNDENSRVTDRFFGNGKIRGFEPSGLGPRDLVTDDALGGNLFAAARFEADFPLGLPEEYGISGGLFADFGSVWSLNDTAGLNNVVDDDFHLRSSVGFSLFWTTPIGPLRFNFAKAMSKQDYDKEQVFDLTISTKF
ncbi:outer membrane protein assembly factor BamA [Gemmobacter fulvus]|uniref:Outer membrane protein assembly factor BamA n=2 Tax=Gemmobacter fulvus TaxID=2840474 RepID=A0A975S1Y7_9RHOB|nr:outer membrane protein assembly factor BamA [Gemmobacter fulvus]MBT9243896.1 outer membrane protein assembly factor BamA [Gemmobacter fulvus]QWK90816.1 outer membrane protein assembly factor BamA [Gemmobacter fulvus]